MSGVGTQIVEPIVVKPCIVMDTEVSCKIIQDVRTWEKSTIMFK